MRRVPCKRPKTGTDIPKRRARPSPKHLHGGWLGPREAALDDHEHTARHLTIMGGRIRALFLEHGLIAIP